jgi:hypothetical protein
VLRLRLPPLLVVVEDDDFVLRLRHIYLTQRSQSSQRICFFITVLLVRASGVGRQASGRRF